MVKVGPSRPIWAILTWLMSLCWNITIHRYLRCLCRNNRHQSMNFITGLWVKIWAHSDLGFSSPRM
jgi:hypothetical protein